MEMLAEETTSENMTRLLNGDDKIGGLVGRVMCLFFSMSIQQPFQIAFGKEQDYT
jgi:hypothetical protein